MTRTEAFKMVREQGSITGLVTNLGFVEVQEGLPAAEEINAAYWAIVNLAERMLVDVLMAEQKDTAEMAWKLVVEEEVPNRVRERLRPKFAAEFPGAEFK